MSPATRDLDQEHVEFYASGARGVGEFCCASCGYGIVVRNELPRCPMCGEAAWEETAWRPFSHDGRAVSTAATPRQREIAIGALAHGNNESPPGRG
jgi:hypothetical protein